MKPIRIAAALLIAFGLTQRQARAQAGAVFVARPDQIVQLIDRNGDGDFFDFAEQVTYSDAVPAETGRLTSLGVRLFLVAPGSAEVFVVDDLNQDGDALDFAEVRRFAQFASGMPTMELAGIAVLPNGRLFTAEVTSGRLVAFADLNNDGDALDAAESEIVADGLTAPTAVAARPDGVVLLAQDDSAIPVRILQDRNSDGDFLDFAENISYAEQLDPGQDLVSPANALAFLSQPLAGVITTLRDVNGDDDVLDFAEALPYAVGMDAPTVLTSDGTGGLFVAADDAAGTVYHVRDLNGDGDALDFAEVIDVAQGLPQPTGIVFVSAAPAPCVRGDVNNDSVVNLQDVAPFVQLLLNNSGGPAPCEADASGDGTLDGRDVQSLVDLLFLP